MSDFAGRITQPASHLYQHSSRHARHVQALRAIQLYKNHPPNHPPAPTHLELVHLHLPRGQCVDEAGPHQAAHHLPLLPLRQPPEGQAAVVKVKHLTLDVLTILRAGGQAVRQYSRGGTVRSVGA